MDVNEIAARAKSKKGNVSPEEMAHLIANDPYAFWAFLIRHNPAAINDVLRHDLGYDMLSFEPKVEAIGSIIQKMLDKNDLASLKVILSRYKGNWDKMNPEVKDALQKYFN